MFGNICLLKANSNENRRLTSGVKIEDRLKMASKAIEKTSGYRWWGNVLNLTDNQTNQTIKLMKKPSTSKFSDKSEIPITRASRRLTTKNLTGLVKEL